MNNTPLPHSDQVTINDQLAQHLETLHSDLNLGKASRQWHMTVLFYAAVHWVEEQFQQKNTRYPSTIKHAKSVCAKYGPTKRPRSVPICNWNIYPYKPAMTDGFLRIRIFKTPKTISNM